MDCSNNTPVNTQHVDAFLGVNSRLSLPAGHIGLPISPQHLKGIHGAFRPSPTRNVSADLSREALGLMRLTALKVSEKRLNSVS